MSFVYKDDDAPDADGFAGTIGIARRRWLLIVGIVAACVLVAAVRHERGAKTYTATANVAFQATTLPDAALEVAPESTSEPQRAADTEVLIAHSSQVAEGVREELHTSESAAELLKLVSVEAAPNADILNISAATSDPAYSARLANAFAEQYIAFKTSAQVTSIEAAERKLAEEIASQPVGSAARAALEQSEQRLAGLRAVAGGGANIISLATPPATPSGMGLAATAVIALFVGLAIAFCVVFLLEAMDRRVKTIEGFERDYRLPALAGIPQAAFGSARAAQRASSLEPYRILRSALDFAAIARPLDSLLVTSAVPNEGKTTVAVDLAHAIALTGRRVVVAELDLRCPSFARQFELPATEGLMGALTRGGGAAGMLWQPLPDVPNLYVLPAGRLPPNPSELLGSPGVSKVFAELTSEGGTLIIDAPPLNPVSDAHVLLNNRLINAVLVVARANSTTREEVRRARAILDRHTVAPVGIVVTGLRDVARYGYEAHGASSLDALGPGPNSFNHDGGTLSRPAGRSRPQPAAE